MTCCVEDALKLAIAGLANSPIRDSNVFLFARFGAEEQTPYCVLQIRTTQDKITSEGATKKHSVSVQAFFLMSQVGDALGFKSLVEAWLYGSNCVSLGECGCFCVQSRGDSQVVPQNDGKLRYEVTFSGTYKQSSGS